MFKVADETLKAVAAGAVFLFVIGRLAPLDFLIILGLGAVWFARTKSLRGSFATRGPK